MSKELSPAGVPEIPNTISCTRADAEAGVPEAQFGMAVYVMAGGTPQHYADAVQWYLKAAEQNHRMAQFNLGQMFAKAQGVERDDSTARMWIERAANGGDAGAQFNLAERCDHGSHQTDMVKASESRIECFKWFALAADQGYRNAEERGDTATLRMTDHEVHEARRRVTKFVPA
ncbi:MAG TPA: tetratricopeptide repeat protein [Candidatus Acidoferrum sp.]|nr:tetratricopeptide repeat protein [Candidatus Acidoferrum sp.]